MRRSCSICGSNDRKPRVKFRKANKHKRRPARILAHQACLKDAERLAGPKGSGKPTARRRILARGAKPKIVTRDEVTGG